jgi:hypothetical protein
LVSEHVQTSTVSVRWNLPYPFPATSTTSNQPSWSLSAHPPPNNNATHIHDIIFIHQPFIQRSVKSNIYIFEFAIVFGQYSYFYKLGETGCYKSPPLRNIIPDVLSINMTCMYKSKQNQICLFHGIFHFPCSLIWAKMFPLHLDLCNGLVPERGFLFVQYTLRFW